MAFRATNIIPENAFSRAKSLAASMANLMSGTSSALASGAHSEQIFDLLKNSIGYRRALNEIRAVPGIVAYAQSEAAENDQTYDVAAEFIAMVSALDALIADIIATFPTDGGGYLLAETLDVDGNRVPRQFSGAALAGIRVDLDAVAASVT